LAAHELHSAVSCSSKQVPGSHGVWACLPCEYRTVHIWKSYE
jgi:hypothetical protein